LDYNYWDLTVPQFIPIWTLLSSLMKRMKLVLVISIILFSPFTYNMLKKENNIPKIHRSCCAFWDFYMMMTLNIIDIFWHGKKSVFYSSRSHRERNLPLPIANVIIISSWEFRSSKNSKSNFWTALLLLLLLGRPGIAENTDNAI